MEFEIELNNNNKQLDIGIKEESRRNVAEVLKTLLANEFTLSLKTKGAHWNVVGADFVDKHQLFESQYEELSVIIDDVAERIRQLGFATPVSMAEFSSLTTLKEKNGELIKSLKLIECLLEDHEEIIRFLRKSIDVAERNGDDGTADFFIATMQQHEKTAWFLRSHLI